MDIDFFKGFETAGSVKLGKELAKKFVSLNVIDDLSLLELMLPEDGSDAGESIEVYSLEGQKYAFVKALAELLSEECYKILNVPQRDSGMALGSQSNPKVLSNIIALILDDDVTSFMLG